MFTPPVSTRYTMPCLTRLLLGVGIVTLALAARAEPEPAPLLSANHPESAAAHLHADPVSYCASEAEISLPHILELESAGEDSEGAPLVRVRIDPQFDAEGRLDIRTDRPNSFGRQSAAERRVGLRRGGPEVVRYVRLDPAAGKGREETVRADLVLENDAGEAILHVTRELKLGSPDAADSAPAASSSDSNPAAPAPPAAARIVEHPSGERLVVYTAEDAE